MALGDTFQSKVFLTEALVVAESRILVDGRDVTQENFIGNFTVVPDKKGMHIHKTHGRTDTYEGEIRYYVH